MPKLLHCIPCMAVLRDTLSQSVTLASIYEDFTLNEPIPANFPEDYKPIGKFDWIVDVLWYKLEEDGDTEYDLMLQVVLPTGEVEMQSPGKLKMIGQRVRCNFIGPGLPVEHAGEVIFRLNIKHPDQDWTTVHEYPVLVRHKSSAKPEILSR